MGPFRASPPPPPRRARSESTRQNFPRHRQRAARERNKRKTRKKGSRAPSGHLGKFGADHGGHRRVLPGRCSARTGTTWARGGDDGGEQDGGTSAPRSEAPAPVTPSCSVGHE